MTTQHGNLSQARATQLQVWLVAALDVLDDARAELNRLEYQVLLDILAVRIARDYVALLLDDKEAAA